MRITLERCIWRNIVRGAAKDNIVNISQGPRHCQCKKILSRGKAENNVFLHWQCRGLCDLFLHDHQSQRYPHGYIVFIPQNEVWDKPCTEKARTSFFLVFYSQFGPCKHLKLYFWLHSFFPTLHHYFGFHCFCSYCHNLDLHPVLPRTPPLFWRLPLTFWKIWILSGI